ncbi:MAG: hypothetical protein JW940_33490 [Polyangiaceae bacterium]|nr:hypothetical protein [Polyangiaceae bacterium]
MRTTTTAVVGTAVVAASLVLPGCGGKSSAEGTDGGNAAAARSDAGRSTGGASNGDGAANAGARLDAGVADGAQGAAGAGAAGGSRSDAGSDTDAEGTADASTAVGGDSGRDGGSVAGGDGAADAADAPSDAAPDAQSDASLDAPPAGPLCEPWQRDFGAETQWAMNAWGLERSGTIFQGRIEEVSTVEDALSRALVTIEKMWLGWGHFEGHAVAVDLDPEWLAALGGAETVIFGVQRPYPLEAEDGVPPRFDFVEAAIPASEADRFPGRIGYHASDSEWVGVARMTENDGQWQRFEVVQTLSGRSLDGFETHFVPFDGVPLPAVSETEYLIAGTQTGYASVSPDFMRIDDFRVATEEARALVEAGLGSPPEPMAVDRLGEDAERYRAGWLFALSSHVVAAEVSGMASECCTNSGGTYAAYDVVERYRGGGGVTGLARFFVGAYPDLACGDGVLLGFEEMGQVTPEEITRGFACDLTGDSPVNPDVALSQAKVTLPTTAENTTHVQAALESAGPLYRLYNLDETVDPSSFPDDDDIKLWSLPLDVMDGISAAEQMIWLEVEDVIERDGWTEVRIATFLTESAVSSREPFHLKLALPCGDARLKQVGGEWFAGLVDPPRSAANEDRIIAEGELFLVPGVLVPRYFGRMGQRF